MMRSVVLAHLDWQRPNDPRTGLGVASIAAATRAAGAPTTIVSDAVNRSGFDVSAWVEWVLDAVRAAGPEVLLGVSAYVWSEPEVQALMDAVRRRTGATVVVGGPQVSYLGLGQLERHYPQAHAFVRGHGEAAMVALAAGEVDDAPGVHVAGEPDRNRRADVSLDQLASPYVDGGLPIGESVRWETQRGCPYACSFCQHREPGSRLKHRNLGVDRLRDEAERFAAAGVRRISVLDPIFHANRQRAIELLAMFREVGLKGRISLQGRFELVDDRFLDALDGLDVELEFGLQTAVEEESLVIGRRNHMDRVARAVEALNRRGIPYEVSLIYGLPLQTVDSFHASIAWCREHAVPSVRAWPLMLLRGTLLAKQRAQWGYRESEGERIPIVVESRTFSRADHAEMQRLGAELEAGRWPTASARVAS